MNIPKGFIRTGRHALYGGTLPSLFTAVSSPRLSQNRLQRRISKILDIRGRAAVFAILRKKKATLEDMQRAFGRDGRGHGAAWPALSRRVARMANRWNIPEWLEREVIERDQDCVYCRRPFGSTGKRGSFASWEHIINDAKIITRENIALCCRSCNSSKGAKLLADWLSSAYCERNRIYETSVADIVNRAMKLNSRGELPMHRMIMLDDTLIGQLNENIEKLQSGSLPYDTLVCNTDTEQIIEHRLPKFIPNGDESGNYSDQRYTYRRARASTSDAWGDWHPVG